MAGLIAKVKRRLREARAERRFRGALEHLHGPEEASPDQDPVVIALVRDGIYYLETFLNHYRSLGARHFVFCDNGSTDGTVEHLRREADCVVLRNSLPWGEVENRFRRYAAERYAPGRWCLFADMDEIFVCPEGADLSALTKRLDGGGHTALVAQMLEMVPQAPLQDLADLGYEAALEEFEWYDLRQITPLAYHDPSIGFAWYLAQNEVETPEVKVLFGGLRKRVFGEQCCLTKHPLVKLEEGVLPGIHPHAAAHVRCAPFTALIKHYKFAGDVAARDADTAARGVIPHGEDRARLAQFEADPALRLWSEGAQRFTGQEALYDAGFLVRPRG